MTLIRLLDTRTGEFVEKDPEDNETVYAVLSHTWNTWGEQTYGELLYIRGVEGAGESGMGEHY